MEASASPFGVAGLYFSQAPMRRAGTFADAPRPHRGFAREGAPEYFSPAANVPAPAPDQSESADQETKCENDWAPAELLRLVQALMAPATRSRDLDSPAEAAAAAFTRAVQEVEAQRRQGGLTSEQSAERIRAAWDEFEEESRLVRLKVVAWPDGCVRQWRPLFGGQWSAMSDDGALVGIGVNQVRVFRDGYASVVENVTTDRDLTKNYRLAPSPD